MRGSRTGLASPRTVAVAAVAALTLLACGGSNFSEGTAQGGGESGADDAGGSTGGPGELQLAGFASSSAEDEELRSILSTYSEQSGVNVEFNPSPDYDTTLQAALAGGTPPDLFYVNDNRLADLAEAGTLAEMSDLIDNPDDFYPALREAFSYEGTMHCPPKDFSTLALQYNTDMFEEAGIDPPTNWEELRSAAEQLTTDGVAGLVLAPEWFRWGVFVQQAGGGLTNDENTEMTLDEQPVQEALSYLEELYSNGWAVAPADIDAGWAGEAFGQEKAAMTIEGNWIVPALSANFPDVNWAVAELPEGPEGQATYSFSVCYAVAQSASNPEASWELANYLVSSEQLLQFTEKFPVMPSRPSLEEQWIEAHPDLEPFLTSAEFATAPVYGTGFQGVLDTLNAGIQGIAAGNDSVDSVIEQTQQAGQGVLGS